MQIKRLLQIAIILLFAPIFATSGHAQKRFVSVRNGMLVRNGQPYRFVGTNFWYGPILASTGQGGNRQRLKQELDALKKMGVDNLRILVGADGQHGVKSKIEPTLQKAPGVYNDTLLAGLDYLLMEMGKRGMVAVLYLNNSWEWSGGYGFYLSHAGKPAPPIPAVDGYETYVKYMTDFARNEKAQQLFFDHVKFIVNRTNRFTHKPYKDDPAIMSWQIGNEPRAFDKSVIPQFEKWLKQTSALIRQADRNHLICIGTEGAVGCEWQYDTFQRISSDPNIDYCNMHIWPYNWGWSDKKNPQDLTMAKDETKKYIDRHVEICKSIRKPIVLEEFGYPRDSARYDRKTSTHARDLYYTFIFDQVLKNAAQNKVLAGCNFWAWAGQAIPRHEMWEPGDDYTGDPAQEPQGLYSVFKSDHSTIAIIKRYIARLKSLK